MIVTDVGGNAEAVVHAKTGLVVPPRNPKAMSDVIITLARNPEARKRSAPRLVSVSRKSFRSINASRPIWTFIKRCLTRSNREGSPRNNGFGLETLGKLGSFDVPRPQRSFNCHKQYEEERRMPSKDLRFQGPSSLLNGPSTGD